MDSVASEGCVAHMHSVIYALELFLVLADGNLAGQVHSVPRGLVWAEARSKARYGAFRVLTCLPYLFQIHAKCPWVKASHQRPVTKAFHFSSREYVYTKRAHLHIRRTSPTVRCFDSSQDVKYLVVRSLR